MADGQDDRLRQLDAWRKAAAASYKPQPRERSDSRGHRIAAWDDHDHCVKCRLVLYQQECSPEHPCRFCVKWGPEKWALFRQSARNRVKNKRSRDRKKTSSRSRSESSSATDSPVKPPVSGTSGTGLPGKSPGTPRRHRGRRSKRRPVARSASAEQLRMPPPELPSPLSKRRRLSPYSDAQVDRVLAMHERLMDNFLGPSSRDSSSDRAHERGSSRRPVRPFRSVRYRETGIHRCSGQPSPSAYLYAGEEAWLAPFRSQSWHPTSAPSYRADS